MNIKMLKAALTGLVLSISGFANAGIIALESDSRLSGASIINIETNFGCYTRIGNIYNGSGFSIQSTSLTEYCNYTNFGQNGLGNNSQDPFIITFDNTISAFGFELGAVNNSMVLFKLFDSIGAHLESFSIANTGTAPNFFGGFGSGIKRIEVTVDYSILDGIRFVNSMSVPEPSTFAIFVLGIFGLASRKFKR